ncbi:MAG: Asp23/Gls24 family envelope stress response protein [Chlamydiales bacterium]|nr:Asp23/Gls24 family envelope stress response protein [Chlamydiia bacterium]MCP5503603.1 Asp23/Gls24 family envelope stress response protein [Chlamydiales bacterium]
MFADTVFVRDIETRVFQAIVIKCLAEIEGVALLEGTLLDNLLGREGNERIKGIHVEQDSKNHSVSIKVEVNIAHGISIPEKAEEIQTKIAAEVCQLTGLHVSVVHVVFKALIADEPLERIIEEEMEKEDEEFSSEEF